MQLAMDPCPGKVAAQESVNENPGNMSSSSHPVKCTGVPTNWRATREANGSDELGGWWVDIGWKE